MKPIEAPKSKENVPDNLVADASTPKKPADKPAAKEGDDAGDPSSTPAAPDKKPEAKSEVEDPLAGPAKPDANIAPPEIKPIGPVATPPMASKEAKPEDVPAVPEPKAPEAKAEAKPEMKPEPKAEPTPDVKPADKAGDGGDPFSTPDAKPEAKVEKKPEPIPDLPPPETPVKPEMVKPEIIKPEPKPDTPKSATEVPAKPELKPDVPAAVKPEIKPEIKPVEPEVPTVGPKTAHMFEAAALNEAVAKATPPSQISPDAYGDLCKLAEMATYVKTGGDAGKKSLTALLAKLAADPQAAGKLTGLAKSRLDDPSATGGVVLTGSIIVSKNKGELYGTALKIDGQAGPVMVFSSHSLDVNAGDKVLVPGAIVRDPAKNLPGYTGKQPVIVWADSAVKLP